MIKILTEKDIQEYSLPEYVKSHARNLLKVYETNNLEKFGEIMWLEDSSEVASVSSMTEEFTEVIFSEDEKIYHVSYVLNNDYSIDVYVSEKLVPQKVKADWNKTVIRTIRKESFR